MRTVCKSGYTDEEAMALAGLPDGWVPCCAGGWWFASRPDGRWPLSDYKALGPFLCPVEMAAAVDAEDRRTRAEGDRRD